MKVIIAGGRDYHLTDEDFRKLDRVHAQIGITEVVSGCQRGADRGGELWAARRHIPVKPFPADWPKHGKRAGPIRNKAMAAHVGPEGLCILFPGGKGTESMREEAIKAGVDVIESEDLE